MNTLHFPLAIALVSALAAAQATKSLDLPTVIPVQTTNNYPFAGPIMRYQMWYSPTEWLATAKNPVRAREVQFKTTQGGQVGYTVDIQITIGNGPIAGPSASFDANLVSGVVHVVPRAVRTLPTSQAGAFAVKFPFVSDFVWDGTSGVVLDVRIYSNGNNNQAFLYDLAATASSGGGRIARLYTVNDANATTATIYQPGSGLVTRFLYQEGVTVSFGTGCPGAGNFTPVAGTRGGLPLPANGSWGQTLANAPSQRPALFVIGTSNTMWGTTPLPLDLGLINAFGCSLLAEPLVTATTTTVGGGPGTGLADISTPIPPVTTIVGQSVYAQWFVLDAAAPNNMLCASQGLWTIIGG